MRKAQHFSLTVLDTNPVVNSFIFPYGLQLSLYQQLQVVPSGVHLQ